MLKELVQAVIIYLVKGFPEKLKELSIFVLKKKEKKDYLLLGAYRPIVIENMLIKLAKKVLTIYIAEKAEAEILLL